MCDVYAALHAERIEDERMKVLITGVTGMAGSHLAEPTFRTFKIEKKGRRCGGMVTQACAAGLLRLDCGQQAAPRRC